MIVDGKKLAAEVLAGVANEIAQLPRLLRMEVFILGSDPASESFVRIKERRAKEVGIECVVTRLAEAITTDELRSAIAASAADALVVQLPVPVPVDVETVLAAIPLEKDADVLSPAAYERFVSGMSAALVPPVVFAVRAVLRANDVSLAGARVAVVGEGKLVGAPVAAWLRAEGAVVEVVTLEQGSLAEALPQADIVVSGAGVPKLVTPELLKSGVVLIDAGTSESGGVVVGDVDPACAEKARFMTPVPGGIGPLTVAGLLTNILLLAKQNLHS